MSFLKNSNKVEFFSSVSFMAFLFLMTIFTGAGKVSNLFHLSIMLMMLHWVIHRKENIFLRGFPWASIGVVTLFLFYFSLANLWTENPWNIISTIKHSFYLIFFVCMVNYCINRYGVLKLHGLIFFGCFILLLLTFLFVDKSTLLTNRLENGFFAAPENVIDLGGYFALGILSALIIARESGKHWIYLPASLLFIGLLLTQSRGPLLALLIALAVLFAQYKHVHLRHILYTALSIVVVSLFFYFTDYGSEFYARIISAYAQSFIRFGIWQHALSEAFVHPYFGWGFDKQLTFVNSIGQHVTTTHSVYVSTFLKGGVVGVLLLASLIINGMYHAYKKFHQGLGLEASIYLFSLMFFVTQGMFVIGGPGETWVLFWLPLAVVLSSRKS
ncbi:O-antigen ligase family protein [Pantoea sp. EA-12]|uniref:O-antigen ligase family protein n=1 Tax=Pantoea sp. EA-12 TaxID=3043303 RepID=UPI0024B4F598|nr:O-antigen ligase family protein [Pantoea sp. EA-12]MDI9223440.1 O-antigen ligase family protein [Pantoea sp. EA-12]